MNGSSALQERIHPRFAWLVLEKWRFAFDPLVPLLFVLHMVLVFPIFIPNLADIHPGFGEAAYINNGRLLVEGLPTEFGYSPLSAILYAFTYIPVQASPYWLIYSCSIGRLLLFGLLWLSSHLIAATMSAIAAPLVMTGLLIASPALIRLITHGSHALFAAMSAFALWQLLLFYRNNRTKHVLGASFFVGLATLARSGEGLILFLVLTVVSLWLSSGPRRAASLAACILPFVVTVGGYMLFYTVSTGKFDLGIAEYSYFTFEQGHGLAYQAQYNGEGDFYTAGQMDARRIFGTPEENNYSISAAILRNPEAYLQRVPRLVRLAPSYAVDVYGGPLGFLFFLLAARGVIELATKRMYTLLLILALWSSYSLAYLLIVFQPTHFLFPYCVIFLLTSVGLTRVVSNFDSQKERWIWYAALVGFVLVSIAMDEATLLLTSLFLLATFAVLWMTMRQNRDFETIKAIGIILALAALLVKADYPAPKLRKLGVAVDEKATLFLKDNLKPGAVVAAYAPVNVWMSRLNYIPLLRSTLPDLTSDQDFSRWMHANQLDAIYVDPLFTESERSLWALIQQRIGNDLEVGFTSDNGDTMVLFTTTKDSNRALRTYVQRPWFSSKERFVTPG
jgi:hypothetical protein